MFQKIILVGRVGQEPELRYTEQGVPVANFSVATNNGWTDGNGQKIQETTWFNVSVWRGTAEACAEHLEVGQMVTIEGRMAGERVPKGDGEYTLRARAWMSQDGEPRAAFDVNARRVQFGPRANGSSQSQPVSPPPAGVSGDEGGFEEEEEIPF